MESSLGCSRGQRVFGPAHRLGQWQRVEVSEGGTPANVTAAQRPPFTPFALSQGEIISFTQSHGLQCAITAPRSVARRKGNSSARAIRTGHTFRPRSSARGLAWRFGRAQRGGSGSLTGSACAGVLRRRCGSDLQHSARSLKGTHTHTHTHTHPACALE